MERKMRNYVENILSDMNYRDENNPKRCDAQTWDEKEKKLRKEWREMQEELRQEFREELKSCEEA